MTARPAAPFVLLEDNLSPGGQARIFENPLRVIRCYAPDDVPRTLDAMAGAVGEGHYLAGFLAYELGYVLEPKLAPLLPSDRSAPLIWMGVFPACRTWPPTARRPGAVRSLALPPPVRAGGRLDLRRRRHAGPAEGPV